ncbi:hypothetical protein Pelo_2450 [Pelomyxa schiedti]|nr:hypothetical protein Pelo_2450 [Pelomyxa schiedti]
MAHHKKNSAIVPGPTASETALPATIRGNPPMTNQNPANTPNVTALCVFPLTNSITEATNWLNPPRNSEDAITKLADYFSKREFFLFECYFFGCLDYDFIDAPTYNQKTIHFLKEFLHSWIFWGPIRWVIRLTVTSTAEYQAA